MILDIFETPLHRKKTLHETSVYSILHENIDCTLFPIKKIISGSRKKIGSQKNIPKPCKYAGKRPLKPRKRRKKETKKPEKVRGNEATKKRGNEETKNEETQKRGDEETKKRRNKETRKPRNEETRKLRNEETRERKKQRGRRKQRNEGHEETKKARKWGNEDTNNFFWSHVFLIPHSYGPLCLAKTKAFTALLL